MNLDKLLKTLKKDKLYFLDPTFLEQNKGFLQDLVNEAEAQAIEVMRCSELLIENRRGFEKDKPDHKLK